MKLLLMCVLLLVRQCFRWQHVHKNWRQAVAVCCFLLVGANTTACSAFENYRRFVALMELTKCRAEDDRAQVSNYDLVKAAHAIVLAEVTRVGLILPEQRAGTALLDSRADFEIEIVLKGSIEPGHLQFFGVKNAASRRREDDFSSPTTGVNHFAPGYPCGVPINYWGHRHYLLFLIRSGESQAWRFPAIPLSRVNEEVDGEDSPWGQAVKHYIRIASLNDEQAEDLALRDLQIKARRRDDPMLYPPALIDDIERYIERRRVDGCNDC